MVLGQISCTHHDGVTLFYVCHSMVPGRLLWPVQIQDWRVVYGLEVDGDHSVIAWGAQFIIVNNNECHFPGLS